jgi:hypothetical protein
MRLKRKPCRIYKNFHFDNHPTWKYTHTEKHHPEIGGLEFTYYTEALFDDDPNGVWMIPVMTPQAERERLFYEQVQLRCGSLQCAPQWASWLYAWCGKEQHNIRNYRTQKPREALPGAGQYIGFRLTLDEAQLREAISQALRNNELPALEGVTYVTSQ